MERIGRDFTTRTLVLIPVAIALNIAIGTTIYNLKLPIYLDSIGTILVGILAGPWAGALTGLLANVIGGAIANYPQLTAYAGVAAAIGLLSGLLPETGWLRSWWKVVVIGLITGLVSALLSAPVTAYLFGGVVGNASTDAIIAFFRSRGWDVLPASIAQGLAIDPLDKAVTFLLVCAVLARLPRRFVAGFPRAENVQGSDAVPLMPGSTSASGIKVKVDPIVEAPAMSGSAEVMAEEPPAPAKPAARKTGSARTPAAAKPAAAKKTTRTPAAKKPASAGKSPTRPKAKTTPRKPAAK